MRIAILADIHGNLQALDAVLRDIAGYAVDRIVVNGDLVNRGPSNIEVVERLFDALPGALFTLGNHDDLMRKWLERDDDLPPEWFEDPFWQATAWSSARLHAAGHIDALAALPMQQRLGSAGLPTVLVTHGSPRHYREGYGRYLEDGAVEEIAKEHPADVYVGSHTHRPMERRVGTHTVLNTGAVGAPFNGDPRAQYLLLDLEAGDWHASFRAVPYDRAAALQAFHTSGLLEEGGVSAEIFYEELRCARSFLVPFWTWAEETGRVTSPEAWVEYRRAFPDAFRAAD